MQIKRRNQKENNNNPILQRNILSTMFANCIAILFLSAIVIVNPSLSFQFQNNDIASHSSDSNSNDNLNANSTQTSVFSADSKPYGLTYGEWTAKWWQWAYLVPKEVNPAYEDSGKYCSEGQSGPVWFLTSTYKHPVDRYCTIPAEKAILFTILNSECSYAEFPNLKTEKQLRQCSKEMQDSVIHVQATVDGISVEDLDKYRLQSPLFNFTLPKSNILELPANITTQSVSDGNWVFLKPLSVGEHVIYFKGTLRNISTNAAANNNNNSSSANFTFAGPYGWDYPTTYHITVTNSSAPPQQNLVKLLADMVRNRLHDAVNLLEITSKDSVIQNVSFANFITKKYMGIPDGMDLPKRKVAQDILARDKDFGSIYFVTPKADVYIGEPFSDQKQLPRLNFADRDWYKGVTATNNTYTSAVFMSASIHVPATAIATPVYSLQDITTNNNSKTTTNKLISGYWVGILDLHSIQQSIKNLNLTNDERIVVVDHNGTAIVDYSPSSLAANNNNSNNNTNLSKIEDFGHLNSVKAVIKGNAGSTFETVNGTKKLSIYQPFQVGNRLWGVILIKPGI
jgi:hypothetical protein